MSGDLFFKHKEKKMKKLFSILAGICLFVGCSNAGEQISLAGKKFVMQNSEAGTTVTLEFADSGNDYYGQVVNNYFGSYKIFNDRITFSAGGTTMMMGPREEMEAEGRYFADLDKVRNFTLQNDILTLITSDGKALTFEEK